MTEIMRVEDLRKTYGSLKAVDGISFSIPAGSCFGLLGPNGAGKTTTIEMMEGIHAPDSGRVLYRGEPIGQRFKQEVGIQFQSTALPEFITVKETLELFAAFYPHPRPLEEVIRLCSLQDILSKDNQKLSGGQRQRMLLGIAITPKPDIVFLDEPTTGLDPQARRNFWELIRGIRAEGTTVLLTTHYMDEAELLCDQIAIMDHGRILELDEPDRLLEKHFAGAVVTFPLEGQGRGFTEIRAMPGLEKLEEREGRAELETEDLDAAMKSLLGAKLDLSGLSIHKPDLEDLFIKLTGGSLRV
jgi:ABC-2 type transport system ATP-binding protein